MAAKLELSTTAARKFGTEERELVASSLEEMGDEAAEWKPVHRSPVQYLAESPRRQDNLTSPTWSAGTDHDRNEPTSDAPSPELLRLRAQLQGAKERVAALEAAEDEDESVVSGEHFSFL